MVALSMEFSRISPTVLIIFRVRKIKISLGFLPRHFSIGSHFYFYLTSHSICLIFLVASSRGCEKKLVQSMEEMSEVLNMKNPVHPTEKIELSPDF